LTEDDPSLAAVRRALVTMQSARERAEKQLQESPEDPGAVFGLAHCDYALAGMLNWRWILSKSDEDLQAAIEALGAAVSSGSQALARRGDYPIGRLAHTHLRLLLLLRVKDQSRDRPDVEHHREAILTMSSKGKHDPGSVSYLRWYQAIALADAGDGDGSRRMALVAFSEDAKLMSEKNSSDIGRRQYTLLRRFIEHNAHVLRNPSLVGHISQVLHLGHHVTR